MGLGISQRIIELMNGEISVESKIGEGSVFKFVIEMEPVDALDSHSKQPSKKVIGLDVDQPEVRILIVEDNDDNRLLLTSLLKSIGLKTKEATNGFDGIEICKSWGPDLVLMDMRMPEMDGYEATRRIKNFTDTKIPVVIAVTASAFKEDIKKVLSVGCDDFIRKPIQENEIFEALVKHLGVKFTYEETKESIDYDSVKSGIDQKLTKKDLLALPKSMLKRVEEAAMKLDLDTILLLTVEIRQQGYGSIAAKLANLAKDYRFNIIKGLIKPAR